MHNDMQYDPIQGQGHDPFRVGNLAKTLSQRFVLSPSTFHLVYNMLKTVVKMQGK